MTSDSDTAAKNGEGSERETQPVEEVKASPKSAPPPPAEAKAEAPVKEAAPAEPTPEQKAEAAQTEAARLRDQLLRTAADFDNFRKRARREETEAQKRAKEGMLRDLLPVFDNLERAIQHADGAQDVKAVADGLRMVMKQFVDTLDRSGIKRVPAVGQPFDPTRHEAIQHLESAQHPAGTIMAEVQPGYTLGDSLVRAAMVVVSKGPPAAAEPAAS